MDFEKEAYVAKRAARKAGMIMEEERRKGLEASRKPDSSIVTEADLRCQRKIVEILSDEFPDDGFLGEEEGLNEENERTWIIDPIDGTTNYFHGLPFYCTSIGLRVSGEYKLGVVYAPRLDELYMGRPGRASVNGEKVNVSSENEPSESLLLFSPAHSTFKEIKRKESEFRNSLFSRGVAVRDMGSGVLELVQLGCGRAEGFVTPDTNEWDFAAGLAFLTAAGGEFWLKESRYRDEKFELVASNSEMFDFFREEYSRTLRPGLTEETSFDSLSR